MEFNKPIKALQGAESLLLIFPKKVGNKLNIADQEWLTFEVRNKELVIKKIADVERSLKTNDLKDDGIGVAVA
jgi:bifunctional DNA-binding transcriptional regulator/antitoxin component of YhaV-PrlF toxin-antitoxin module